MKAAISTLDLIYSGLAEDINLDDDKLVVRLNGKIFETLYGSRCDSEPAFLKGYERHYIEITIDNYPVPIRFQSESLYPSEVKVDEPKGNTTETTPEGNVNEEANG